MSRRRSYSCWWCGEEATSVTAHLTHTTRCDARPERGTETITRCVSCPACAGQIDLRTGRECPDCGRVYAGRMGVGDEPEVAR